MPNLDQKGLIHQTLGNFFAGLPSELMDQLATIVRLKHYRANEVIFEENSAGEGFHMVAEGRVKIFKTTAEGKEQILHIFGPGEPFGEAAIFLGRGYPANALALSRTATLFFPRAELRRLISANAEMAFGLLGVMAQRLARFTALLEAITLKEVPARLAAFILELAQGRDRVELTLSKSQLSSLLGTTPETISRSLGRLKSSGLIAEEKPFIIVTDRRRLELAAEGLSLSPNDWAAV